MLTATSALLKNEEGPLANARGSETAGFGRSPGVEA